MRVQSWGRPKGGLRLPAQKVQPRTFVDADGKEYTVTSGKMETPLWPEGPSSYIGQPAKLHLPRPA